MRHVNGSSAALAALFLACTPACFAADDLATAARELAHKAAAFLGPRAAAAVTYRNRSSLPDSELSRVRREFEAILPPVAGLAPGVSLANHEIRITLSENVSQYLLIAEVRRDDETQTWISAWNRVPAAASPAAVTLDRKLIWEQKEPILDATASDTGLLVLSPAHLTFYQRQGTQWMQAGQVALALPRPWPRDPRGRLRRNGSHVDVFLPGAACQGDVTQTLSVVCQPSAEPWVLESGSRYLLLADFAAERNYFSGRVVLQDGTKRTVPPFYSAAAAQEASGAIWLLALVDGQTEVFSPALTSAADTQTVATPTWGSDIVGVSGCADAPQVLATRPADSTQPDAVQAFSASNRIFQAASAPMPFAGTITAFWPASPGAALAVVHDPVDREYRAYVVTLVCGN